MEQVDFQIVANFMAGKGSAKQILSNLELFLKNNGKTFSVLTIDKPTSISKLPNHNQINEGLICIGGDGTVSESVGYILNHNLKIPLAIIPTGTANFIADAFGLDNHHFDFMFLLDKKLKKIDIGMADYGKEKNYILLGFGLGFEEKFSKITKEKFKSKLGIFSYIFAALAELLSLKRIPITIKAGENIVSTDVCTLMVLNIPPKILRTFPLFKFNSVNEDDGLLSLKYVEYKNYLHAFLGTLALHILGRVNFGLVKTLVDKEFHLESSTVIGTQVDGELKGNLPVAISVLPKSFSFLI